MSFESFVARAAQALLAAFVAIALLRGARSEARRTLGRSMALQACYAGLITVALVNDDTKWGYAGPIAVALGGLSVVELLAFARWYARGARTEISVALPRPLMIFFVVFIGTVNALLIRDLLRGGDGKWELVTDGVGGIATFFATITAFAIAWKRGVPGSRGFVIASAAPLVPIFLDVLVRLGLPLSEVGVQLIGNLGLLAFVVLILFSYANEGLEPMSLGDRMISSTLLCVLALGTASAHLILPRVAKADQAAIAYRLTAALASVSVLVVIFGPWLYRRAVLGPVGQLMWGFARAEAGERVEIPVTRNDELGGMALSFNNMVSALAEGRAELKTQLAEVERHRRDVEDLNEELRRQVAARSRQLATLLAREDPSGGALTNGATVDGRYRIEERLGGGGMGIVYGVRRIHDDRRLALKVMTGGTRDDAVRFTREAEIAAKLHHPNLAGVLDVGMENGTPYLVMERLDGGALADASHRFGDVSFVLPLLSQVSAGLEELHARGILHRDLKPANVLLTGDRPPIAKICDFGIARAHSADELAATVGAGNASFHTAPGVLMGTYAYMAPELAHAAAAAAADVFAFGVMAYEALGVSPFQVPPIFDKLWGRPIPDATLLSAEVPTAIAELLARTIALDPSTRPTAREIHEGLGHAA